MKTRIRWTVLVLTVSALISMSVTTAAAQTAARIWIRSKVLANDQGQPDREIAVDAFQVAGGPLGISNATLTNTKQGYELQFSGSNNSNEQLIGVRYILLFVDAAGTVRSSFEQSETLKLAAYSSAVIRFRASLGFTIDPEDRAFLITAQVVGQESIWETSKGKDALQHYAKGDNFSMPDVRRFPNLVDAPTSGLRIIP